MSVPNFIKKGAVNEEEQEGEVSAPSNQADLEFTQVSLAVDIRQEVSTWRIGEVSQGVCA